MTSDGNETLSRADLPPTGEHADEQSLRDWMHSYGDVVLRTAALLLGDRHLAEDVSQETFIIAFQKRHQLLDENRVRGWLVQIAVNLCRQRKRKFAWSRLLFREKIEETAGATIPSPEESMEENIALKSTLMESIGQLTYPNREVIILYYYQSLSIDEISGLLKEAPGTIKSRISRARNQLREILREILREDAWFDA